MLSGALGLWGSSFEIWLLNFEFGISGLRLFVWRQREIDCCIDFLNAFIAVLIFQMGCCWFDLLDFDTHFIKFYVSSFFHIALLLLVGIRE